MERDPKYLSYYERLGISEVATHAEIAAAYKALRKEFHPDAKPAPCRDYFDHMMKGINEAHDVLKNPAKRRQYDARLSEERRIGPREQQASRQRDNENTTHERSRKSHEDEFQYQHCEWYGLVPTPVDYAYLVNSYDSGVSGLERRVKGCREALELLHVYSDRVEKRELARVEQAEKSNFVNILRDFDEKVFGELLAAIHYVESYLSGLPKHRRRISAKHADLKREASALLDRKIVT